MGVKDYDLNPDNNTQINGINIAEGCPPSGINNAIRQLMADVKADAETPASAESLGRVKVGDGLMMGEDGTLSLDLVDAVDSTSTTQAATANAVNTAYEKAEEAASDVANVMSAVNQVQADVSTKLENSTVHIVKTWKSNDGKSWYRKYSDGFIEQGGAKVSISWSNFTGTLNLNTPFNTTSYVFSYIACISYPENIWQYNAVIDSTTSSKSSIKIYMNETPVYIDWYACGY